MRTSESNRDFRGHGVSLDSPAPIIDYASPRKRGSFRLAARSQIVSSAKPGELYIVETLSGKESAMCGITFAILMLVYMTVAIVTEPRLRILGVFWILEAVVMLAVIHQTWQKTVLMVTRERVQLKLISPLLKSAHEWPVSQLANVSTFPTGKTKFEQSLGELRLLFTNGQSVFLFTDHPATEINNLISGISKMLQPSQTANVSRGVEALSVIPLN